MRKTLKNSKFVYLFLAISYIGLIGCNEDKSSNVVTPPIVEDVDLILESFVFEKKNNPELNEDIIFNIKGNTISGELKNYFFNSIPTFLSNAQSVEIDNATQISSSTAVDFRKNITYTLKSSTGITKKYTVDISWDDALAHIYFDTDGGAPIISKDDYLYGVLIIDGQSKYENLDIDSRIKGRGNSTWSWPKKPYKMKLSSKESVLGLLPEKDWVLLADYQDGPHLLNAVALKIGRLLEMPFTNTIIPVELTINNEYLGLYGLTEQIEVKTNRVNVGKNDGLLLELEQYYDEEWKFRSSAYNLPVMVKDPELDNAAELWSIQNKFETFEALVANDSFPNNEYLDHIDAESISKYLIVYMLTANNEINHPKSTYMHKTATGKFVMGPIWDFDWAYGFESSNVHFTNSNEGLLWTGSKTRAGTRFFSRLMTDPKIQSLMQEHWGDFKNNSLEDLMDYIDEYAFIIEGAKARNLALWNAGRVNDVDIMKQWLEERVKYMDNFMLTF